MYLDFGVQIDDADCAGALNVSEEVLTPLSQSKQRMTELLQLSEMRLELMNPKGTSPSAF